MDQEKIIKLLVKQINEARNALQEGNYKTAWNALYIPPEIEKAYKGV